MPPPWSTRTTTPSSTSSSHWSTTRPTGGRGSAHVRLNYAVWLRRCRRTLEARQQLTTALETAERLGAGALAAAARRELRASGAAPTPKAGGPLEQLTAQQLQIVQMAARGLSNREIGEQLFLSPRTVGSHLYHVYPKLGISRRQQLSDLLQDT